MVVPTKQEIINFSDVNVGKKEEVPNFKRKAFSKVKKLLKKTKLNIAISGMRRVGKTTLIKQILNELGGFYFSFDEHKHQNYESLKKVIEVFIEEKEKPLIALDEIGKIKEWSGLIKKYYDQNKARFIVSGSSSLSITKGKESLAGRLFEITLPSLQYDEFIELKYGEKAIKEKNIFKENIKDRTEEFMLRGSFPEATEMGEFSKEYIEKSIVEKVVFEDIPSIFPIEYKSKLFDLIKYAAEYSSQLFFDKEIGETIGINKGTVKEYLFFLSYSYLIKIIYNKGSYTSKLRKMKKLFISNASLYNALALNKEKGKEVETAVMDKLSSSFDYIEFYRDSQKREVDFIVNNIPIEVKYRNKIVSSDLKNILYFMKKKSIDKGIIITKETLDEVRKENKRLLLIPLNVFLSISDLSLKYI